MPQPTGGTEILNIIKTVIRLTDSSIPGLLALQQKNPQHRDFKGQMSPGKGFGEPGASGSAAATLTAAYFCPESFYYKQESLLSVTVDALEFLLSRCHDDGTIDLMETNYRDCTYNAFTVQILAYTYRLLEREAETALEVKAKDLVLTFLKTSVKAMLNGGFHTPNHRWVIASALSLCAGILDDKRCSDLAGIYLSEDIDQNADGDYTERSAGVYDAVCNESLCILAQELNIPALYDYVDSNLKKNLFYLEPDFTVLTLASRRQDYGKDIVPVRNFLPALLLYRHNGSDTALVMATELLRLMDELEQKAGPPMQRFATLNHQNLLTRLLLEPALASDLPNCAGMPMKYEKHFSGAGIVRYRHNSFTATIIRDNPTFLKIQNGYLKAYIRLAASFFGRGKLCAQSIEEINGGYRCIYKAERGYLRPMENIHEKDWEKIDHSKRETANIGYLEYQADIYPDGNSVALRIRSTGTTDIPFKIEFIFEPEGILRTAHTTQPGIPGGYAIAGENFEYERYGEKLLVEGGFNMHDYAPSMRGSEPMPQGTYCVFFTGFTPVDAAIKITAPPYAEI